MSAYTKEFSPIAKALKVFCKENKYEFDYWNSNCVHVATNNYRVRVAISWVDTNKLNITVRKRDTFDDEAVLYCSIPKTTDGIINLLSTLDDTVTNCMKHMEIYKHNVEVELGLCGITAYKTGYVNTPEYSCF